MRHGIIECKLGLFGECGSVPNEKRSIVLACVWNMVDGRITRRLAKQTKAERCFGTQ